MYGNMYGFDEVPYRNVIKSNISVQSLMRRNTLILLLQRQKIDLD